MNKQSLLALWKLTEYDLTIIVEENPSLRGFMLGYVGEYKFRELLHNNPFITGYRKPDDHDRKRGSKNELIVQYKGHEFTFEVKSLQTNSIKYDGDRNFYSGKAQVDASDRRTITFPDGTTLETTCLLRGEFDILAVNLFQFRQEWDFAFILNRDLPSSGHKKYTDVQRRQLLATSINITWPVSGPFVTDPILLLERLIAEI